MRGALLSAVVVTIGAAVLFPASAAAQAQDRDCGDFANQADAQQFFEANGGPSSDPHQLDGDGDGSACETLPCPCAGDPQDPPPPPPPPPPNTRRTIERVSNGTVTVELSYVKRRNRFGGKTFKNMRVAISRGNAVVRDDRVPRWCSLGCFPLGSLTRSAPSIRLRDLDDDFEPEVMINLWSGGARCCTEVLIYGFRGSGYERDRFSPGVTYRLADIDVAGPLELRGWDERLNYAFTCGACGPEPVRIWQYDHGTIKVTTRDFPGLIRKHARRLLRGYRRNRTRGPDFAKGYLTPYVAELCLLNRCRAGLRAVQRARRRGVLDRRREFDFPPFGSAYVTKLKRLLRRTGYMR